MIAELFEQAGVLHRLFGVAAARTEPHPESAAQAGGESGFAGESVLELVVELPKARVGVVRPAVVHDIAVEGAQPRPGGAFRHLGEGLFYAAGIDVEHVVVPAVELQPESRGAGDRFDIGEKCVLHGVEVRALRSTKHDGGEGVDPVLRHLGEAPARVVDRARLAVRDEVVAGRAFKSREDIRDIDRLPETGDDRRDERAGSEGSLP